MINQKPSYGKALLTAFFSSFAAPLVLCIAAAIKNILEHGQFDIQALLLYGLAVLLFSVVITCALASVVIWLLRVGKIPVSDGISALVIAIAIILADAFFLGFEHAFPWIALPVGANALLFLILERIRNKVS